MKIFLLFLVFFTTTTAVCENFPIKPIKIVVYTKAGGLIDVTARKLAKVIEEESVDVPIIIENLPGGAGQNALNKIINSEADGYSLLAVTNSFISQTISIGQKEKLDNLEYLAILAKDDECLIVNKNRNIKSIDDLINKSQNKPLIWAGPAAGGADNLFAKKVWKELGIKGKWLPYQSGKRAMLAVVGGYADVYVGNVGDILGFDDLEVLAISSKDSDLPTFKSYGINNLDNDVLWRGFAIKKGTSEEVKLALLKYFKKASQNKNWKDFLSSREVSPVFIEPVRAKKEVDIQIKNESLIVTDEKNSFLEYWHYFLAFILFLAFLLIVKVNKVNDLRFKKIVFSYEMFSFGYLLVYLVLIKLFGYYIASAIYIISYGKFLKLNTYSLFAIVIMWSLFSYYVFEKILNVVF